MANHFRELLQRLDGTLDALRESSVTLTKANEEMARAHLSLVKANDELHGTVAAALEAEEEHEDLRESVQRLETLVMQQGHEIVQQGNEIRALRNDLHGGA